MVRSMEGDSPVIHVNAEVLRDNLEQIRHFGDSMHANKFEMEAQRALVRHAIRYRVAFELHDDHWGRTGFALVALFEEGLATLETGGLRYKFLELSKESWVEGTDPMAQQGGFLYRDPDGKIILKMWTWIS